MARKSSSKIHTFVQGKLVFPRLSGDEVFAVAISPDDLNGIPPCVIQQVGPESYRIGLRDGSGVIQYFLPPDDGKHVKVSTDPALAATLTRKDHIWKVGDHALSLAPGRASWKQQADAAPTPDTITREDFPGGPIFGHFYQIRNGRRYDLVFEDRSTPALLTGEGARQSLLLAGDHFSDRRSVGVILCSFAEDHVLAAEGDKVLVKWNQLPRHAEAVRLVETWHGGRVAFRSLDGRALCVRDGLSPLTLKFDAKGKDEFFEYEPDFLLERQQFRLVNRATKHCLTAGDATQPEQVSCEAFSEGKLRRQLWSFSSSGLTTGGRQLRLLEEAGGTPRLSLQGGEGNSQFLLSLGCLHHTGGRLLVETERDAVGLSEKSDSPEDHQHWSLQPYRATPEYGRDRFSVFEGERAFAIGKPATASVWTRSDDGTIRLEDLRSPRSEAQTWVFSRGYLMDLSRTHLLVYGSGGLVCVTPLPVPGVIPEEHLRARWGMTNEGRIVSRDGGRWGATFTPAKIMSGPFSVLQAGAQEWSLVPFLDCPSGDDVYPLAEAVVIPFRKGVLEAVQQRFGKDNPKLVEPMVQYEMEQFRCHEKIGPTIATDEAGNLFIVYLDGQKLPRFAVGNVHEMALDGYKFRWGMEASSIRPTLVPCGQSWRILTIEENYRAAVLLSLNRISKDDQVSWQYSMQAHSPGSQLRNLRIPLDVQPPYVVQNVPEGPWLVIWEKGQDRLFRYLRSPEFASREISFVRENNNKFASEGRYVVNPVMKLHTERWAMKTPAAFYHDDRVYRLVFHTTNLFWDGLNLVGTTGWESVRNVPLPQGVSFASPTTPLLTVQDGVAHIALTTADGAIWVLEWEPGAAGFRRKRKIANIKAEPYVQPAIIISDGFIVLAYNGTDGQIHVVKLSA